MKCPKCQYELIENAKFCQNCGINVDIENDTKNAKQLESNNSDNSRFLGTILGLLIVGVVGYGCITQAIHYGDTYRGALQDIKNEQWSSAKSKLEELGNYRDCETLLPDVNYNYYLQTGNENFNNKNYSGALSNYEQAKLYKNTDETLTVKIQKTKDLLAKQEAEQRKAQEIAKKKAEQAKRQAELAKKAKTQKMLNNVVILSQYFGYSQYGEKAIVGKIKNNNSFPVQVRADIDLKDYNGNIVGTTYTYDRIAPYSVWNFEAPTFGVSANHTFIHLTIDEL